MSEPLLTIGEVAERAQVATSTIRYYERLDLLVADPRRSGQRRYYAATLRRLVFIGMLQDAGLALADIAGILDAEDVSEWKAIATRRLEALDEEIATLRPGPWVPLRRAALPLRPPGNGLQDHGSRDRSSTLRGSRSRSMRCGDDSPPSWTRSSTACHRRTSHARMWRPRSLRLQRQMEILAVGSPGLPSGTTPSGPDQRKVVVRDDTRRCAHDGRDRVDRWHQPS